MFTRHRFNCSTCSIMNARNRFALESGLFGGHLGFDLDEPNHREFGAVRSHGRFLPHLPRILDELGVRWARRGVIKAVRRQRPAGDPDMSDV